MFFQELLFGFLQTADVGESMFIHTFGAYFGLAVARVLYSEDIEKSSSKEGAVYHSDLFSMIGDSFMVVNISKENCTLSKSAEF